MDYFAKFNVVIDYIENKLIGEINYSAVARVACCFEYHFSRILHFHY